MKKLITTALSMVLIGTSFAAEKEKVVKSDIDKVTVFLQGAQITRESKIYIDKGVTKVIVEGITQGFNPNSIQVKGKGDFIIMDVSSQLHYPEPEPAPDPTELPDKIVKEIHLLKDSISDIYWDIQEVNNKIKVYESEKNLLTTSGVIKGQASNDSILALKDAMNYLRDKMIEINGLLLKAQIKQSKLTLAQNRMNKRLVTLQNYNQNIQNNYVPKSTAPVQQIVVTVSAEEHTSGYLDISYMVNNAGWSPAYDLRADDISSPVKLTYKANVYQSTGIDWDNVDVTLSTINPNRSNVKPTLAPWYIRYYQPVQTPTYSGRAYPQSTKKDAYEMSAAPTTEEADLALDDSYYKSQMKEAEHMANYTQMSESMTMVEFELKLKQSIPSDGQNHMMAVKSENIESSFEHFIVPKMDNDAFLVAHMTGWEELNLLPAVANIYYDGTYVGQTRINPSVMSDTLDLALGRDRGIYVTRKKVSDEEKVKALSSEKTKTVTYEIAIKNYKSSEINLTIEDQIPVSNIEDIKVTMGENSGAEYNEDLGYLKWKRDIKSKETQKFKFTYTLKFDKDKELALN
ncbi:DUF4139 domain-containing protein [Parvicella tangerina]|uniref:Mucoidy inhibitor MuiA family protein n=1 Tax=Parvicella tangerina TaxID=2829795 RepID=A0A916JJY2_9FLAO|nr:DUF4139 domain-containing protein [Parvicella tangerina]CAG5078005.1 hypothetical protein CRYO30217_00541 [Parvicella tangerina]